MAEKTKTSNDNLARDYVIPLREKCRPVPRYKKTNKAIKTVKKFLARHMKIRDRDLKKIRLDRYLNEFLWARGIKNPPHKVKVKAVMENDIVRVELADFPDKLKFKKAREEKYEKQAEAAGQKKKSLMEKMKQGAENDAAKPAPLGVPQNSELGGKETEGKKAEEKEKKAAVVEAGAKMEKSSAQQMKHTAGGKTMKKTQPVRKSLAK